MFDAMPMLDHSPTNAFISASILIFVCATGCDNGRDNQNKAPSPASIEIIAPRGTGAVNPGLHMTIEAQAGDFATMTAAANGAVVNGIKTGTSYFMFDIPVGLGENTVVLHATSASGTADSVTHSLSVVGEAKRTESIRFSVEPATSGTVPTDVTFAIETGPINDPRELLVDYDGDGVIDHRRPYAQRITNRYEAFGYYKPRLLVRDAGGMLHDIGGHDAPAVEILRPTVKRDTRTIARVNQLCDLEYHPATQRIFALSSSNATISVFDEKFTLVDTVRIPGAQNPRGIAIDRAQNIYIADTGRHRIIKLLASANYGPDPSIAPDGSFGGKGSAPGQFNLPIDVAIEEPMIDNTGIPTQIFVTDQGNKRVQRFSSVGAFEIAFAGDDGALPALAQPAGIVTLGAGGILVVDTGNHTLRVFSSAGRSIHRYGGQGSKPGQYDAPLTVARDFSEQGFVVADSGNRRVVLLAVDGRVRRAVSGLPSTPLAALVLPTAAGGKTLAWVGDGGLAIAPVRLEPPDQAPRRVVERFFESLAAGRFEAARKLLIEKKRAQFDATVKDPKVRAQFTSIGANTRHLAETYRSGSLVTVAGICSDSKGDRTVQLTLRRNPDNGLWLIANY